MSQGASVSLKRTSLSLILSALVVGSWADARASSVVVTKPTDDSKLILPVTRIELASGRSSDQDSSSWTDQSTGTRAALKQLATIPLDDESDSSPSDAETETQSATSRSPGKSPNRMPSQKVRPRSPWRAPARKNNHDTRSRSTVRVWEFPIDDEDRSNTASASSYDTLIYRYPPVDEYEEQVYRMSPRERRYHDYIYEGGRRFYYDRNYFRYSYRRDPGRDIYRFGFREGYYLGRHTRISRERDEHLGEQAASHLDLGLKRFRNGQYRAAADAFKLSAETDQGDPIARVYAAHALFASGRYQEAMTYLKRAFALQPKIAYLHYDMRDDYGSKADFDAHLEALREALDLSPDNMDRLMLLGYVLYYSNERASAFGPLSKARVRNPDDRFVTLLLENCRPPDVVLEAMRSEAKK
jgi:tetratricopeptide (TPR) repeat protein